MIIILLMKQDPRILKLVYVFRIEPLLREYLRGEAENEIEDFCKKCYSA